MALGSLFAREAASARPRRVVEPGGRQSAAAALAELWQHRDLLLLLARRDVSVRYKQALFGFAWAVFQPLVLMAAFTFFLRRSGHAGEVAVDYPVYALAGLVPWTFFFSSVARSSESLVASANLISKVYFPRLAVPLAALLAWLPDLGIASALLLVVMALFGEAPAWTTVLAPAFLAFAVLAAAGISIWASALNVAYRDVKYAVPFLLQLWLFATPVIYSATVVDGRADAWFGLNPLVGVIEGFRWSVVGTPPSSWATVGVSAAVTVVLLLTGLRYFRRVERYFADVI